MFVKLFRKSKVILIDFGKLCPNNNDSIRILEESGKILYKSRRSKEF